MVDDIGNGMVGTGIGACEIVAVRSQGTFILVRLTSGLE
jgi:hypothetical protein